MAVVQRPIDQREAYLQRNREYKRIRREYTASCTNAQPTPQDINSRINKDIYITNDSSKSTKGEEVVASSTFRSVPSASLQENLLFSYYEKHNSAFTRESSSSNEIEGSGGSGTCRAKAGTRFTISPSGIYLSSISLEGQAASYELKNVGRNKRRSCANVNSQLSHGHKETCLNENGGHSKRKKSENASCTTQELGRNDENSHEDIIYVPKDFFPSINDYVAHNEDKIEYDDVDDESCMYIRPSPEFESYQLQKPDINSTQVDPYDYIYHNLPRSFHFLEQVPNCRHCNTKRFQYDTPTFCCMNGTIKVVTPLVPDELCHCCMNGTIKVVTPLVPDELCHCCMNGTIKVVTPLVPDELCHLHMSQEPNAKYF